jgi:hypothetical protein
MYFSGDAISPHDKSENDQDSDSDGFTYSISLTFKIWVSHA